jgi:hypothetical protein
LDDTGGDEFLVWWNEPDGVGVIQDSTFDTTNETADDDIAIVSTSDGLTVSGNTFTLDEDDIGVGASADTTVENNTFTGSSGVGVGTGWGAVTTIDGNTFDGLNNAVNIDGGTVTITGNTITNSTGDAYTSNTYGGAQTNGGAIHVESATEVIIVNNTISDTDTDDEVEYALVVEANAVDVYLLFNNITGNTMNVDNNDTGNELNATHNWWGDAAGPDSDSISDDVDTSSYLGASVTGAAVVVDFDDADALDAEDEAGVQVSSENADIIGAAAYSGNPQEAIADALAFYDVYVVDSDDPLDVVTIKFYAGDANSKVYAWSTDTDIWVEYDADYSEYGGYVYITIDKAVDDILEGTPFVVVAGEAEPEPLGTPVLQAPDVGDDTVSLTPTFSWGTVAEADGYYFQFADNANFVLPLVSLDGDLGRLMVTAYAYVTELPYSTAYYWRVKAVSGTIAEGDLLESAWASGVFITMDEPVEPVEPADIILEPADITLEPPDIIVTLPPPAAPITPAWIYVIIGVGAVLVIALLVLIVRTRRVA